jgi:hypothetical protein
VSLPFKFLDGTIFGPRFVLSIVVMLISAYWEEAEAKARIMSPYWKAESTELDEEGV